jgi:hypothetical protein
MNHGSWINPNPRRNVKIKRPKTLIKINNALFAKEINFIQKFRFNKFTLTVSTPFILKIEETQIHRIAKRTKRITICFKNA